LELFGESKPFRNVQFIIAPAPSAEVWNTADLNVTVDSKARSTAISGDFKRDFESKEGGATATYTLNVKTCNPACKR
jgi:hypothetical protein